MKTTARRDQLAIAASGVCAVHCLLAPLVVMLTPVLHVFGLTDEAFHQLLLFVVLPTSVIGLTLGCRHHRDVAVIVLGAVGASSLALVAIDGHPVLGEAGERVATVAGSSSTG